jgi:hypothetical protein
MQVIVVTRLHAMYQQSRQMLVFLSGTFLAIQIACVVIAAIESTAISGGKLQLFN